MAVGARETKKLETRRALAAAAVRLATERGLHGFTLEEVAHAAGVSPRTFFNHFATKETALTDVDADELLAVAAELEQRPAEEGPVSALAAVLVRDDADLAESASTYVALSELVRRWPELVAAHLAAMNEVEATLAAAMARRLGAAPTDVQPAVVVAATMASFRAAVTWHHRTGSTRNLREVLLEIAARLERAFEAQP